MSKKHSDNENFSFQEAIKGVKPIKNDRIDLYAHDRNTQPYRDKNDYSEGQQHSHLSDNRETAVVSGEEAIFFARSGVQQKLQKQLRQGKVPVEDHHDLHGLTIEQAREDLQAFIQFAQQRQMRCVILVHGKGYRAHSEQPILKNKVNCWLRQHPDVLAFSSALPKDGGTGAVYILIKKEA